MGCAKVTSLSYTLQLGQRSVLYLKYNSKKVHKNFLEYISSIKYWRCPGGLWYLYIMDTFVHFSRKFDWTPYYWLLLFNQNFAILSFIQEGEHHSEKDHLYRIYIYIFRKISSSRNYMYCGRRIFLCQGILAILRGYPVS